MIALGFVRCIQVHEEVEAAKMAAFAEYPVRFDLSLAEPEMMSDGEYFPAVNCTCLTGPFVRLLEVGD